MIKCGCRIKKWPRRSCNSPGPGPQRKDGTVDTISVAPSTRTRTTRHHRCDHEFLELLEEDFGIPRFALVNAFMGMPAEPKKEAIALCEWAAKTDEPARALLAWARKNGRGTFRAESGDVGDDEL